MATVSAIRRAALSLRAARGTMLGFSRSQQSSQGLWVRGLSSGLKSDSFMTGTNSIYAEQMYDAWRRDPASVHASWAAYFNNLEHGVAPTQAFSAPGEAGAPSAKPTAASAEALALTSLIRAYQFRGHERATLDPLGLAKIEEVPELDYKTYGFTEADLDRPITLPPRSFGDMKGILEELTAGKQMTLREVIKRLESCYCSNMGVEYMHMGSREKCNWIRDRVENRDWMNYSAEKKKHVFERLCFAVMFESYVGNKYNTVKRFGLDGGESVIPGLKTMVDRGSELGIESFVLGMPHRGRLNVLANVMRKDMPTIFQEFAGTIPEAERGPRTPHDWASSHDVKYHLGTSLDRTYPDGRKVHMSLLANPSHLEAVDPVVCGKTRAKQFYSGNTEEDKKKHMAVLMHGDAAFAGQGVVYETMQLARVPDFGTGGTLHVVVNNQIGFTTNPTSARSTRYCSDIGKAFDIPIFHCNGDDPLSVVAAFEMAVDYRQQFGEDCILDIVCYRRHGHNELDQPAFTQPLMYAKIRQQPDVLTLFEERLIREGAMTKEECEQVRASVLRVFEENFEKSKTVKTKPEDWLSSRWKGFKSPKQHARIRETGVDVDVLRKVGLKLCEVPEDFALHPQLQKILSAKKTTVEEGKNIDWGTAEALAFGTLLLEGNHVRLSGQDVERGTFSHRHAVLHDQRTGDRFVPLNTLTALTDPSAPRQMTPDPSVQAKFTVRNSILSEFGVLGFEHGYSLENPNALILWEAQFGDFVNGAQVMIDQFISAGEDKWLRQSGLTMLLPHGYDGQGAEHSSARMERFLGIVDEDANFVPPMGNDERMQIQHTNWQVVNCSTPANYFHVLRRQIHRDFRKPLVVFSPKNLLRHRLCVSDIEHMGPGTRFHRVYRERDPEVTANPEKVRRLVFCTGKIYYELLQQREEKGLKDIAIVRIEQLAPFPFDYVARECARFPNAEVLWAQEEPQNMGAWHFVRPRIRTANRDLNKRNVDITYHGRLAAAAPATGLGTKVHQREQQAILDAVIQ